MPSGLMDLHIFVVAPEDGSGSGGVSPWVVGAWDEYTIDENGEGYNEDVKKMKQRYGARFRVAVVRVPDSFLRDAFKPLTVEGK